MAISTSSYFSNAINGVPQVGGEYVDIFAISATPKYALGTKYERADGEVYRYAHYSSAVSAGTLVGPTFSETGVSYAITNSFTAASATYQMPQEPVGVYPGSKGSRYFLSSCTGTANKYRGGYVSIVGTGGSTTNGYVYRIKSNGAAGAVLANNSLYELYDQLQADVVTPAQMIMIAPCKWNDVTAIMAGTNVPAGVSAGGSTASYFGWVQTKGIVACATDAVVGSGNVVGAPITASIATPGAITVAFIGGASGMAATNSSMVLGNLASAGSVGHHVLVNLMLE